MSGSNNRTDGHRWIASLTGIGAFVIALLGFFGITQYTDIFDSDTPESASIPRPITIQSSPTTSADDNSLGIGSMRQVKTGMVQVYVPAGTFRMGATQEEVESIINLCQEGRWCSPLENEQPPHDVYIDAFWIDKTEIDNGQFAQFVEETGYKTIAEAEGAGVVFIEESREWELVEGLSWRTPFEGQVWDDVAIHPVVYVSWEDAKTFCEWRGGRLPTEAEWEKAARWDEKVQESFAYPWGNQFDGSKLNYCDKNCQYNWANESSNDRFETTAPVGSYPNGASPYGALDMAGNVSEWVNDWYSEDYYASTYARQPNPEGATSGKYRVARSSSWYDEANYMHSAYRNGLYPDDSFNFMGFRCVE